MGILNTLLIKMGLGSLKMVWLGDSKTALWCIAVTLIWQAADYYMVMHIATMDGISAEIYEAAMIDGCGPAGILVKVIAPMAKSGVITVCMISAMAAWNEYPVALVMETDEKKQTLPVGLATLFEVPNAVISVCGPDVRWCGNEAGQCRPSEWSVVPKRLLDTERIQEKSQRSAEDSA